MKVLFFGSLREQLDESELIISENSLTSVSDLLDNLQARNSVWQQALSEENLLFAVNKTMAEKNTAINPGDEIAFFPPVTGG